MQLISSHPSHPISHHLKLPTPVTSEVMVRGIPLFAARDMLADSRYTRLDNLHGKDFKQWALEINEACLIVDPAINARQVVQRITRSCGS